MPSKIRSKTDFRVLFFAILSMVYDALTLQAIVCGHDELQGMLLRVIINHIGYHRTDISY
jgi:hypothetical protein